MTYSLKKNSKFSQSGLYTQDNNEVPILGELAKKQKKIDSIIK